MKPQQTPDLICCTGLSTVMPAGAKNPPPTHTHNNDHMLCCLSCKSRLKSDYRKTKKIITADMTRLKVTESSGGSRALRSEEQRSFQKWCTEVWRRAVCASCWWKIGMRGRTGKENAPKCLWWWGRQANHALRLHSVYTRFISGVGVMLGDEPHKQYVYC